jgi:acetoin utilization protein AcuB
MPEPTIPRPEALLACSFCGKNKLEAKALIAGAMTEKPYSVSPDTPLDEVAHTMASEKFGSAVVVQNGHVVGVFTTVDACRALGDLLETRLRK